MSDFSKHMAMEGCMYNQQKVSSRVEYCTDANKTTKPAQVHTLFVKKGKKCSKRKKTKNRYKSKCLKAIYYYD